MNYQQLIQRTGIILLVLTAFVANSGDKLPKDKTTSFKKETVKMPIGINSGFYSPSDGERPFKAGFKTSNWKTEEDPWNPAFRKDYSIFTTIRYHQWHQVSFSNDKNWSDRPSPDVDYPTTKGGDIRMPYEWEIRMCNDFNTDYWLNCPALATDEYMTELAKLIKENLKPHLKVYLEWSNEVWNGDYAEGARWDGNPGYNGQYTIAVDRGKEMDYADDNWNAGTLYSVHAHVRLWHAFEEVFGDEAPNRVVKVMPGMLDGVEFWLGRVHIRGLTDPKVNIYNLRPDVYAVNSFIGHRVDGESPEAFERLESYAKGVNRALRATRDTLDKTGFQDVELMVYEGGQHMLRNADIASKDPRMYDVYQTLLESAAPYVSLFMHYRAAKRFVSGDAFGMKEYTGQPIKEAHKYRALYDWVKKK